MVQNIPCEDDQSLLIETSSCTPSSFRTNYYSIEILHGVTAIILTYPLWCYHFSKICLFISLLNFPDWNYRFEWIQNIFIIFSLTTQLIELKHLHVSLYKYLFIL